MAPSHASVISVALTPHFWSQRVPLLPALWYIVMHENALQHLGFGMAVHACAGSRSYLHVRMCLCCIHSHHMTAFHLCLAVTFPPLFLL